MTTNRPMSPMPSMRVNGTKPATAPRPAPRRIPEATPEAAPAPEQATPPTLTLDVPQRGTLARLADWTRGKARAEMERAEKARGVWGEHPPSLAYLVEYIQTTKWATSEVGLQRLAALLYGYLVAIPATAALYVLAWIVQRPLRLIGALTILIIFKIYT